MTDLIVGGAGLFGLTIAERAASAGHKVLLVDNKSHVGGNTSSHVDEVTGVEVHTHGSHIFHTNNERVWEYVHKFTSFVPYIHRVRTIIDSGDVIPLPFGLATLSSFYGGHFTPSSAREFLDQVRETNDGNNLEEVALASLGRELYEALIKGYTMKQWGRSPKDLPAETIKRLPFRFTYDDGYFTDTYQGLPSDGYQAWLERMADHPNITVLLNTDVLVMERNAPLVFTGPIDRFFDYKHGDLSWRSVDFHKEYPQVEDYQGCPVMNYGSYSVPWTRIHEYKHYRPDKKYNGTVIHKELSRPTLAGEIGAYPVNSPDDRTKLLRYREEMDNLDGVWLGGRLGTYKYLDMHMAIASALTLWDNHIRPYLEKE